MRMPRLKTKHNHKHLRPQTTYPRRQSNTLNKLIKCPCQRPLPRKTSLQSTSSNKHLTNIRPTRLNRIAHTILTKSLQPHKSQHTTKSRPTARQLSQSIPKHYPHQHTEYIRNNSPAQPKAAQLPTIHSSPAQSERHQAHHDPTQTQQHRH